MLQSTTALRYVTPLREGGSLPGLIEADDLGTYVVKFRSAGQGPKVLVAEVVVGELARRLGIRVPELKTIELDEAIGRREPDAEVQELLVASAGLNLAIDFLPGAFGYDGRSFRVDRPSRRRSCGSTHWWRTSTAAGATPTCWWHGQLWAIDHGAALYFHFRDAWTDPERFAVQPYDASEHVLFGYAEATGHADAELASRVTLELLTEVLALVPDPWLAPDTTYPSVAATRAAYVDHLLARIARRRCWLPGAAA